MKTPSEMAYEWLGENDETKGLERAIEAVRDAEHAAAIAIAVDEAEQRACEKARAALAQSREECEGLRAQVALLSEHCNDHNDLKAQLDRAVEFIRYVRAWSGGTMRDELDTLLASLASPSQPEPVKVGSTMTTHFDDALTFAPIVPENAGTTCGACKGLGAFTGMGEPVANQGDTMFWCGLCGGSGRAK